MQTDSSTTGDPLARLPELPSSTDPGTAAIWAATILLKAAHERGWPIHELAGWMMTLVVVPSADWHTDDELHAMLQATLDRTRARRATKQ